MEQEMGDSDGIGVPVGLCRNSRMGAANDSSFVADFNFLLGTAIGKEI